MYPYVLIIVLFCCNFVSCFRTSNYKSHQLHSSRPVLNYDFSKCGKLGAKLYRLKAFTDNDKAIIKKIPNALTVMRLIAVPAFAISFILNKKASSVAIYVLACITDFLDGYIARKLKITSAFGAFLDPVADKVMVSTVLILLVCQVPTWWYSLPVALILAREITVSALREWMAERNARNTVQVGWIGKIKTAAQMVSTALILITCPGVAEFDIAVSLNMPKSALFYTGILSLYISTILTLVSGFLYLRAAWPYLTKNE